MRFIYRGILIVILTMIAGRSIAQSQGSGCVAEFDLFGIDTLCTSSLPFVLPPALPLFGTYSGTNVIGDTFYPEGLEPGEYTIYYTYSDEFCTTTDSVVMTIIQNYPLEFEGSMSLCFGGTTVITSKYEDVYLWEDGTQSSFYEFTTDTTIYTYAIGSDIQGCYVNQPFSIRVYTFDPGFVISGDTTVCPGSEVTFSVQSGGIYYWFDGITDNSVTLVVEQDTLVPFYYDAGEGCDTTLYLLADVIPLPDMVVEVDTSICYGDSTILTASGALYYKTQFGPFDGVLELLLEDDFTYIIEGFNELECAAVIPVTIVVNDNPELVFSGIEELCAGDSALVSVSGADNFTWVDLDTGQELILDSQDLYADLPLETMNFEVTGTNVTECSTADSITIIVHPMPQLNIEVLSPFCDGEIVTLLATGADMFQWSVGDQDSLYQFVGDEDFSFTLYGQTIYGCADSLPYDAVIHPVPVVTAFGDLNICEGETTTLTASGATFYTWNEVLTGDVVNVSPGADSLFTLLGVSEFGCSDFTNVNINVEPAPILILDGDHDICYGESSTITVTTDSEFNWSDGGTDLSIVVTPEDDSTFSAFAVALNGCTRTVEFEVVVNDLPQVDVIGANELCYGETALLIASGAETYEWSNGTENDSTEVTPVITTNFRVTGISIEGCETDVIYPVTVLPSPYVYFTFDAESICDNGPSLGWVANPSGGVLSGDGVTDSWFNPADANIGLNVVSYTVTNEFNCSATASDEITVDDCTAVEEVSADAVLVFPNPAEHEIAFSLKDGTTADICIIDTNGRLIGKFRYNINERFIVSDYAAGVYHVLISNQSGEIFRTHFVKF